MADTVLGGVWFRPPEEISGSHARGVEDESRRFSRQILECGTVKQHSPVATGKLTGSGGPGNGPENTALPIYCLTSEIEQGPLNGLESLRNPVLVETEVLPVTGQNSGGNRAAGHRREPVDNAEQAKFIKSPQGADMVEHRSVTTAGKANSQLRFAAAFRGSWG